MPSTMIPPPTLFKTSIARKSLWDQHVMNHSIKISLMSPSHLLHKNSISNINTTSTYVSLRHFTYLIGNFFIIWQRTYTFKYIGYLLRLFMFKCNHRTNNQFPILVSFHQNEKISLDLYIPRTSNLERDISLYKLCRF